MTHFASLNGRDIHHLSLNSRAAQYGDGVFRTMLVKRETIWLEDIQLETLIHDARAIALNPPDREWIGKQLKCQATRLRDGVIKACLIAPDTPRGYARTSEAADLLIQASPLAANLQDKLKRGARLACVDFQLAANPQLCGIKHLNRLEQVLAKRLQTAEADEALLRHPEGGWVSGIMSNLFWYQNQCWHTPALEVCGIRGAVRRRILEWLAGQGQAVQLVKSVSDQELSQADMIFLCNSLMGAWPVSQWQAIDAAQSRQWSVDQIRSFQPLQHLKRALNHPLNAA